MRQENGKRYVLIVDGRRYDIERSLVVGRAAPSDVVLNHNHAVSRRHAEFSIGPDGIYVQDLGSTNGTFVAGRPVSGKRLLEKSDVVRVGATLLRVCPASESTLSTDPWSEPTPARPSGPSTEPTRPADIFDVLERVALNAVAEGDAEAAERVSGAHLDKVLTEAHSGTAERTHVEKAVRIAVTLAPRIPGPRWINYLIHLHVALRQPMSREVNSLVQEMKWRPGVDVTKLDGTETRFGPSGVGTLTEPDQRG